MQKSGISTVDYDLCSKCQKDMMLMCDRCNVVICGQCDLCDHVNHNLTVIDETFSALNVQLDKSKKRVLAMSRSNSEYLEKIKKWLPRFKMYSEDLNSRSIQLIDTLIVELTVLKSQIKSKHHPVTDKLSKSLISILNDIESRQDTLEKYAWNTQTQKKQLMTSMATVQSESTISSIADLVSKIDIEYDLNDMKIYEMRGFCDYYRNEHRRLDKLGYTVFVMDAVQDMMCRFKKKHGSSLVFWE